MPTPIVVPKSTITMERGTIVQWLKKAGDPVAKDEALLEIETDKAVVEIAAPEAGTLLRIDVVQGEVSVDQVVGWVGSPGESIPDSGNAEPGRPAEPAVPAPETHPAPGIHHLPSTGVVLATPAARRRARELGIDLKGLTGSGPNHRITEEDVESAAGSRPNQESSPRKALVEHLSEAWRTVPHIHIVRSMDMDHVAEVKGLAPGTPGESATYTDIILFTVAAALHRFPALLPVSRREGDSGISLAFAVDVEQGVVAPVIRNVKDQSLRELARNRRELASLARSRKLRPEHLEAGDFTITNLGMYGVDFFAPIINTPQVAILALGQIGKQPVVEQDKVSVGWRMWATLTADHRYVDGALAARFLSAWQDVMNAIAQEDFEK